MKPIYKGSIGGGFSVKVFLDFNTTGSSVEFPTDTEPFHKVTIGADFDAWCEVYDGILHEMFELHITSMELAYQRWYRAGCDSGDVWFNMSHGEYSEVVSRSAQSILSFVDVAKKEFDKHRIQMLESIDAENEKLKTKDSDDESNIRKPDKK